ncbi:MAG TPA: plasmid maintenance protein CcdB [Spongiibacteraceae bacterium]|nr:plasmid maintenance protein CcdB [Spongiibacteraceae bacterium]HCS27797.1 plasmid maintenance protein CcdB [Spongiibacteraceae bacterium]|tara:strand:- start:489 stop:806 length:318 start_codon:yes stop_codon:yes gene_type:complete
MPQFDVFINPSATTRKAFPYIVDIQSATIEDIATRIVVPLARRKSLNEQTMKKLTPEIEYEDETLLLLVPQIASIPAKHLKNPIGSLNHFRDEIVAALDFAITGI